MHQMAQEAALWPSVMTTLGPCWRKGKLNWANIAIGSMLAAILILMLYIVTSCMAQLKLYWLSYSLN